MCGTRPRKYSIHISRKGSFFGLYEPTSLWDFQFRFIHTCPVKIWLLRLPTPSEFPGQGREFCKTKNFKNCMKLNWNFHKGGGSLGKILSC